MRVTRPPTQNNLLCWFCITLLTSNTIIYLINNISCVGFMYIFLVEIVMHWTQKSISTRRLTKKQHCQLIKVKLTFHHRRNTKLWWVSYKLLNQFPNRLNPTNPEINFVNLKPFWIDTKLICLKKIDSKLELQIFCICIPCNFYVPHLSFPKHRSLQIKSRNKIHHRPAHTCLTSPCLQCSPEHKCIDAVRK